MALRAGYYGLKRVIKDKLLNLANAAPADISPDNPIASKSDISATVDLMKDTTGWIGGNELENVLTSETLSNVNVTVNDNKTVNLNGTASENITALFINAHINLKAGKYYLSGNPAGITGNEYGLRISDASYSINTFFEQGKVLELAQDMTDLRVDIRVPSGTVCNNTLFKPMILTEEQYKLNPSYRPYHESVAEMLSPKVIPTAADLNNYITEGDYFAGSGSYSNCPISDTAFRLKVMPFNIEATRCIQIIYANKPDPEMYMRTNFGGNWQSWYKFVGTEVTPSNRDIETEPETKKVTKKKVIKEEE